MHAHLAAADFWPGHGQWGFHHGTRDVAGLIDQGFLLLEGKKIGQVDHARPKPPGWSGKEIEGVVEKRGHNDLLHNGDYGSI